MSPSEFYQFAAILGLAAVAGLIANKLRQPVIVAFVAVGIAVGPVGTGWVVANDKVELLSRLGIAMLLFLVGLKLDVHLIRSTGPVALATGLGQVFVTSVVGFLLSVALGLDTTAALYVAVALTFSSTIIIVKLLSDKRELDELHGRIAVGFLIVQDVVVIMVMITLTALSKGTADGFGAQAFLVFGKGLGLLAGIAVVTRYLLPTFCDSRLAHPSCWCCSRWPGPSESPRSATGWGSAPRSAPSSPASPSPQRRTAKPLALG